MNQVSTCLNAAVHYILLQISKLQKRLRFITGTLDLRGPLRVYVTKVMTASCETTYTKVAIQVGQNCHLTVNYDMKLVDDNVWS